MIEHVLIKNKNSSVYFTEYKWEKHHPKLTSELQCIFPKALNLAIYFTGSEYKTRLSNTDELTNIGG